MRSLRLAALSVGFLTLSLQTPAAAADCGAAISATQTAEPAVAASGSSFFVAWRDFRDAPFGDIYAELLNLNGTPQWTPNGEGVAVQPYEQLNVRVLPDGAGGVFVIWADYRLDAASSDIYGQRLDATGVGQWGWGGANLSNLPFESIAPQLVSDDSGGMIIVWADQLGLWPHFGPEDIYAMRVDASGAQVWTSNYYKPVCTEGSYQGPPQLVSDGAGGAIAVWQDRRNLGDFDIYAARIEASGTRPWTANGVPVCSETGYQTEPQVISDGAGGAFVVWQDARGGTGDVYVQRIDAAGAPVWTPSGVPVGASAGSKSQPRLAPDGSGGTIIVWEQDSDVYAQRFDAAGAASWSPGGVAVAVAANFQFNPHVAPDMSGGAFVAWADDRDALYTEDLYAQHIDAVGVASWAPNGVLVCAPTNDYVLESCADGSGGAILVWRTQSPTPSLRQSRLVSSGPTGVGDTPAASRLRVSPNVPNPFTGTTEFRVYLDGPDEIIAEVYDVTGRLVALYKLDAPEAGWHAIPVSDRDARGRALPSGVYLCRVLSGAGSVTRKMVIAR